MLSYLWVGAAGEGDFGIDLKGSMRVINFPSSSMFDTQPRKKMWFYFVFSVLVFENYLLSVEVVGSVRKDLVDAVRVGKGDESETPEGKKEKTKH